MSEEIYRKHSEKLSENVLDNLENYKRRLAAGEMPYKSFKQKYEKDFIKIFHKLDEVCERKGREWGAYLYFIHPKELEREIGILFKPEEIEFLAMEYHDYCVAMAHHRSRIRMLEKKKEMKQREAEVIAFVEKHKRNVQHWLPWIRKLYRKYLRYGYKELFEKKYAEMFSFLDEKERATFKFIYDCHAYGIYPESRPDYKEFFNWY